MKAKLLGFLGKFDSAVELIEDVEPESVLKKCNIARAWLILGDLGDPEMKATCHARVGKILNADSAKEWEYIKDKICKYPDFETYRQSAFATTLGSSKGILTCTGSWNALPDIETEFTRCRSFSEHERLVFNVEKKGKNLLLKGFIPVAIDARQLSLDGELRVATVWHRNLSLIHI